MTSPLLGVHGRHVTDPVDSRAGIVVSADMDHQNGEPYLWIFLDTPKAYGAAFDYVPLSCFAPTDPEALRQRLTPRDHIAEARAAGDALGVRLLDGARVHHLVGDAARALVHAALGDYPQSRLNEIAERVGGAIASTALGSHPTNRRELLLTMADRIGRAVKS